MSHTVRFSYAETRLDPKSALKLAKKVATSIGKQYEDSDLLNMASGKAEGALEPCCSANKAGKDLCTLLAKEALGWASLLSVKGEAARDLHDLACWKVEALCMAILRIEEALLERDYLAEGEDPEPGRRVMEVTIR